MTETAFNSLLTKYSHNDILNPLLTIFSNLINMV